MPLYRILSSEMKLQAFRAIELGQKYQEKDLEDWIEANPEILVADEPLLIIGRQVNTPVGIIDLLALDSNGSGVVVELKRAPDQRGAVSQSIEYASWLTDLNSEDLSSLAEDYFHRRGMNNSMSEHWQSAFGSEYRASTINQMQRLFIVIEGEHDRMSSMVRYLRTTGLDISLLSYNFYLTDTGDEILHLETQVGEMEMSSSDEAKLSEGRLISNWSDSAKQTYAEFKSVLLAAGIYVKPKKTGMSFSVQTMEGSVFVCFFIAIDNDISIWLRNDSLQALINFEEAAQNIKDNVPNGSQVSHRPVWFILRSPATRENGEVNAKLILKEVVERLRNRS